MLKVPANLAHQYDVLLDSESIEPNHRSYYKKWLGFYLDFCHNYTFSPADRRSLPQFNNKLREKRQSENLRKQAQHAISLFYEMIDESNHQPENTASTVVEQPIGNEVPERRDVVADLPSGSPQWENSGFSNVTVGRERTLKSPHSSPLPQEGDAKAAFVVDGTKDANPILTSAQETPANSL